MRWLHLSDIHVGNDNTGQANALDMLVDGVHSALPDERAFHLVIITGDLTWSGRDDQFRRLGAIVAKLRNHSAFSSSQVLTIPGNHDLDCDETVASPWRLQDKFKKSKFFDLGNEGEAARRAHARGFQAYDGMTLREQFLSLKATKDCAHHHRLQQPLSTIISLNTALLSHKDSDELPPFPLPALRRIFLDITATTPIVVLGHHPIDAHAEEDRDKARKLLDDNGALYLHGHSHKIAAHIGPGGHLRELGFGASYITPLESPAGSPYTNSFAFCELHDEKLEISFHSWNPEPGQWAPVLTPPTEIRETSTRWKNAFVASLRSRPRTSALTANPSLTSYVPEPLQPKQWLALFQTLDLQPACRTFRNCTADSLHPTRFWATSADASSLTYLLLVSDSQDVAREYISHLNSEMDAERADAAIIVSFAKLQENAETLANKLGTTKKLALLDNLRLSNSLAKSVSRQAPLPPHTTGFVIHGDKHYILVDDANEFFLLDGSTRALITPTDPAALALQKRFPEWSKRRYRDTPTASPIELFDRAGYLQRCASVFNEVRYAGLAAIGVRLQEAKLTDVYVTSTADHTASGDQEDSISRAVAEYLDSLGLDEAQRTSLEDQITRHHGLMRTSEASTTHDWYESFGSLLVLGDPGAGKSIFVKREILAYSRCDTAWYTDYLPIYIPLAEIESALGSQVRSSDTIISENQFLEATSTVANHRGFALPVSAIESALAQGKAALFFDGLDEIGSPDTRAAIMSAFSQLFEKYSRIGCRFVLSSRPAAAAYTPPPKGLQRITLRGLSDEEMQQLAERVLRALSGGSITASSQGIIDSIVADCRRTPGIRRLAQNPLILSLIVVIYANSGAPAARRHRIYTQAVQTLVSIRNREVGRQALSESDLRSRLGRLALATFQRTIGEIPSKNEVLGVFEACLRDEGTAPNDVRRLAEEFLASVATSTGLLIVASRGDQDAAVMFMHQSFREYYAACEAARQDYLSNVEEWSRYARWREVISLMSGLISDSSDPTPLFEKLFSFPSQQDTIAGARLLFSIDCAIECDVPPDRVQRRLYESIAFDMREGASSCDPTYRIQLAERLLQFARNAGLAKLESFLIDGIRSADGRLAACFIDLATRVNKESAIPRVSLEIQASWKRTERPVRIVNLFAIGHDPQLRNSDAVLFLKDALRGNVVQRHGALAALLGYPEARAKLSSEIRSLIIGDNAFLAGLAATVSLEGTQVDASVSPDDHADIRSSVAALFRGSRGDRDLPMVSISAQYAESMCVSDDANDRDFGYALLSWISEPALVYKLCQHVLSGQQHGAPTVSSLNALRTNERARAMLTLRDHDVVLGLTGEAIRRDVRIAAFKLLKLLPIDQFSLKKVLQVTGRLATAKGFEKDLFKSALSCAGAHASGDDGESLLGIARGLLEAHRNNAPYGDLATQRLVLSLESLIETNCDTSKIDKMLWETVENFRAPLRVRKTSLRLLCESMEISAMSIDRLIDSMRARAELSRAFARGLLTLSRRGHESVSAIRAIVTSEKKLVAGICNAWRRRRVQLGVAGDDNELRSLREAMHDILGLTAAYSEYSQRIRPSDQT